MSVDEDSSARSIVGLELDDLKTGVVATGTESRIEYGCTGTGSPVLLLSPFRCDWVVWAPVIRQLRGMHRLVMLNHPGIGRSHMSSSDLANGNLAGHVEAALGGLGITEPVAVIGWSFGGLAALHLALAVPERVRCLTLVCAFTGLLHATGGRVYRSREEGFAHGMAAIMETVAALRRRPGGRNLRRLLDYGQLTTDGAQVEAYAVALNLGSDAPAALEQLSAPTLVVGAGRDLLVPGAHAEAFERHIPGAESVVFPEAGHYLPLEYTDEFCTTVSRFLARAQRAARAQTRHAVTT